VAGIEIYFYRLFEFVLNFVTENVINHENREKETRPREKPSNTHDNNGRLPDRSSSNARHRIIYLHGPTQKKHVHVVHFVFFATERINQESYRREATSVSLLVLTKKRSTKECIHKKGRYSVKETLVVTQAQHIYTRNIDLIIRVSSYQYNTILTLTDHPHSAPIIIRHSKSKKASNT
jgi:hypothetical protein